MQKIAEKEETEKGGSISRLLRKTEKAAPGRVCHCTTSVSFVFEREAKDENALFSFRYKTALLPERAQQQQKGSVFMAPARLAVCWHPPPPTPILSENEKSFFLPPEREALRFHFAPSHVSSLPWKWTENEMGGGGRRRKRVRNLTTF